MTLAALVAASQTACSSASEDTTPAASDCGVYVDRFKALEIIDEGVIGDARAKNANDGPWSFRRRMEEMTAPGGDPTVTAQNLLKSWLSPATVNLYRVPARSGASQEALCNWLRSSPANECDGTCVTCKERTFDLSHAPFRLIAIVNRGDLRASAEDPGAAGEARFIYALTQGAGDDAASTPLNMTLIFEYRQVLRGRTLLEIDRAWQKLGEHPAFDESYKNDLEAIMRSFTEPGADPTRPLGSALGQLRTNERQFDWAWDMREFKLADQGFNLSTTENTPDATLSGSSELSSFLNANKESILAGKHVLPPRLQGGAVGILSDWTAPGVETSVLTAFSKETCNGCHQIGPILDFNFHISPMRSGVDRLSRFLNNPADPQNDELARRERFLAANICAGQ